MYIPWYKRIMHFRTCTICVIASPPHLLICNEFPLFGCQVHISADGLMAALHSATARSPARRPINSANSVYVEQPNRF